MLATVSNGGIERLDDLHVNVIDEGWNERTSWVAAGLIAYGLAVRIRRELGLEVTVALGFSLVAVPEASMEKFETQEEFEKELDWSPPSLYLFKAGDRQYLSATALSGSSHFTVARRHQVVSSAMGRRRWRPLSLSVCRVLTNGITGEQSRLAQLPTGNT
jgi:hypothetical protein